MWPVIACALRNTDERKQKADTDYKHNMPVHRHAEPLQRSFVERLPVTVRPSAKAMATA